MILDTHTHPRLLVELARVTREDPVGRKMLVCPRPAEGRELLHSLALAGVPWVGWEVTSLRQLAHEVVALDAAREGWRATDEFDVHALVDEAIDAVAARGEAGPFATEAGAGFRDAIRRSLEALREAGIDAATVRRASRPGDGKMAALAAVLEEVEAHLSARRLMDGPAVLAAAVEALREGRVALPEAALYLLPGHPLGGVAGRLVRLLVERGGARLLPTDAVIGLDDPPGILWSGGAEAAGPGGGPAGEAAVGTGVHSGGGPATGPLSRLHAPPEGEPGPEVEFFAAATPTDELREVLRRAVAARIPWDRIEIVATDPQVYGAALDGLARRLGIPVTYAAGQDARRTRVGRAAEAYLRWIEEGYPAEILLRLLEAGDLAAPDGAEAVSGTALARRLRRLHVGWGRDRYLPAVDRALAALREAPPPDEDGDEDAARERRDRESRELEALRALLERIVAATPALADRAAADQSRTSPAEVAKGLLAFLSLVPTGDAVENTARKVLLQRLERMRATLTRETTGRAAVGIVRSRLETRVAPSAVDDRLVPWTPTGGHLHLSDLATGGLSGRPHIFVVGLDAGSVSAGGVDPLLADGDRVRLNREAGESPAPLPLTAERAAAARHRLAAMLARLRGRITLSYSAWDAAEGRAVAPAPELLQALRLREGDPSLTYEDLRARLGPLVSAVPRAGAHVEPADVWLDALSTAEGGLRSGVAVVRAAHPGLDRGLVAAAEKARDEATSFHGKIRPRPELNPRRPGAVLSPSRLEALGACPRRYFIRYVLGVRAVRDPEWDPERWLDALDRGTLLHAVYERTLDGARRDGIDPDDDAFEGLALRLLREEIERTLLRRPAPNDAVRAAGTAELEADVRAFVDMIRRTRPDWDRLELDFGSGTREVSVPLPGGEIRLAGRVDRIDRTPDGGVRIVDYKTGSPGRYRASRPFEGGRRLQHILYSLAVERLLGKTVEAMEYHFPTVRGQNERVVYRREAIADGPAVVEMLLEIAAAGHFLPTDDAADCGYCDYQAICRARTDAWGKTTCPDVAWAKGAAETGVQEYERLRTLREQHA
jgi:ATP-dependent helicase/nuclease subunit B